MENGTRWVGIDLHRRRSFLASITEQVADCFADSGYAFVEQDKIDGLAVMLNSFLTVAGITVNPPKDTHNERDR